MNQKDQKRRLIGIRNFWEVNDPALQVFILTLPGGAFKGGGKACISDQEEHWPTSSTLQNNRNLSKFAQISVSDSCLNQKFLFLVDWLS